MANKAKNDDRKLSKLFSFRCTTAEFIRWSKMANESNLTMGEMLRAAIDGNQLQSKATAVAIAELRHVGSKLKAILESNPTVDEMLKAEIETALSLMIVTMNKVMEIE